MAELTKEQIGEAFTQFLDENGQWFVFKDWCEERGYTLEELGIKDEE